MSIEAKSSFSIKSNACCGVTCLGFESASENLD